MIRASIGATLVWTTPPAEARDAPPCAARSEVVARLAADFGETPRGLGLAGKARLIELFASEATGTWTLLRTEADGTTCLLAAGRDWLAAPAVAAPAPGRPL
ncbi:MAG: hypothetical protein DI556_04985 [Rhodovulum sulfidophilum]|uniref:Uncharacterized protein n=1 Tax=Rhodovulum sulfidophilum TaxID=35806 RepID=A0A2W5NHK6_RHOSU|nr:MAG: hypothetical protein DI556_04985 [Rhodovulum sulfidophilum]